jgi:type IX secretion system PorP/SprF family membrane protein
MLKFAHNIIKRFRPADTSLKDFVIRLDLKYLFLIVPVFVIMLLNESDLRAQDIHFSQFYAAPLMTNPANTGMSGEDMRIAINYRNQWAKVGTPYETFSASLDRKLAILNQSFGIGGVILHDQSSSFNLSANEFLLSLSYSRIINNHQFTIGLQPGFVSKAFNLEGLTFGSQFDPTGQFFNGSLPSLESGLSGQINYLDINAGIFWRTLIRYIMPSAGISVSHVNLPMEKFSTSSSGTRLAAKLTFNGEVIIPVNSRIDLTPLMLYSYTPGTNEFMAGTIGGYSINSFNIPVKKIYALTMIRLNPMRDVDAVIFGGGAKFLKFNLGISYDFNISPLRTVTNFNGGFEISLIYTGSRRAQENPNIPCYIIN